VSNKALGCVQTFEGEKDCLPFAHIVMHPRFHMDSSRLAGAFLHRRYMNLGTIVTKSVVARDAGLVQGPQPRTFVALTTKTPVSSRHFASKLRGSKG
jgi:hypothetical protein